MSQILGMLLLVLSVASYSFGAPHGSECRVVSLDQHVNPWEEGLGVFGDPDSDSQNCDPKENDFLAEELKALLQNNSADNNCRGERANGDLKVKEHT